VVAGLHTRATLAEIAGRWVTCRRSGSLLFNDTIAAELAFTGGGHGLPADLKPTRACSRLGLADVADRTPRDSASDNASERCAHLVADPT
jgi:hypothetical protein